MKWPEKWSAELELLRDIIEKAELTKVVKWGMDVYMRNGVITVGYSGFKDYVALWFHHGVFLSDPEGVLVNAQEGKTKALRQWRFYHKDEIDEGLILSYIQEAIANVDKGLIWKPQKSAGTELPEILDKALKSDAGLLKAYDALPPYKRKEYEEYLAEAKREATRQARLEKIIPMIREGKRLNDAYKKGKTNVN